MPKFSRYIGQFYLDHLHKKTYTGNDDLIEFKKVHNNPSSDAISTTAAMVWSNYDGVLKELKTALNDNAAELQTKLHQINTYFEGNAKTRGTLSSHTQHVIGKEFEAFGYKDEELKINSAPWILSIRKSGARHGPAQIPMPGVAHIYYNCGEHSVMVFLFPVANVLAMGISLPDLFTFVDTKHGQKYLEDDAISFVLRPGHACYYPYGFIPVVAFYEPPSKKVGRKNVEDEGVVLADLLCYPILVRSLLQGLPASTMHAIEKLNADHHATKGNMRMWVTRATLFNKLRERRRARMGPSGPE